MISRRMFLSTILSAVAAGTILVDTKVAEAISLYPSDRISILITRAREAVATSSKSFDDYMSASPEYTAWMAETDKIFGFIETEFPVNPSFDEVEFFFAGLIRADGLDEDSLRIISVELVPLAVVRSFAKLRLPLVFYREVDDQVMPNFNAYIYRMRPLIINTRNSMTVAGRELLCGLDTERMTNSQRAAVLAHYYAARDAGRLDQPIDAKTVYEAANA